MVSPSTGKSHLATGLAIAACRQRRRVRFTTAAALGNQLVEAQREQGLCRMLSRWSRVELIVIDELRYLPLAEVAAEPLFQVIAERAEKAAVIVTTSPSPSGRRFLPTLVSATPCSTGLSIRRKSSRQIRSRTPSGGQCGRSPKSHLWRPRSVLLSLRPTA